MQVPGLSAAMKKLQVMPDTQKDLNVCSVGCGPCAELVAFKHYLSDKKMNIFGYDICDWSQVCGLLDIPFAIKDINKDCKDLQKYDLIMCLWTVQFLETIEKFEAFILDILTEENVLFVVNPEHKLLHYHHNGKLNIQSVSINVKKSQLPTDCNYTVSACLYSRRSI